LPPMMLLLLLLMRVVLFGAAGKRQQILHTLWIEKTRKGKRWQEIHYRRIR